jgi:hypothetical protein
LRKKLEAGSSKRITDWRKLRGWKSGRKSSKLEAGSSKWVVG